jgi:phospholipid/cholesterol/gamma-HCH transport system ATP-binding protein
MYLYNGRKEWEGSKEDIIFSKNDRLNEFIFASEFLQGAKAIRMLEVEGKIQEGTALQEAEKLLKEDG